ncbi:MAG: cyclomaltodextrinase C-terminal domain-containing protein, partial [Robiginitalea sp.]|uniref:cyclomaltodextrinase C-terminal domain-containing protein n=1 Tax=Robiginitalea sp. TaxID=1902411 RepID=UPI003C767668
LGGSAVLTRMALAFILVAPRIPQIYYGTEILMDNSANPGDHGLIRSDFPGGWEADAKNGFSGAGLAPEAREMQDYLKKVLNFRKGSSALKEGKTLHFVPEDGIYVLVRSYEDEIVVLVLNKNEAPVKLATERFRELGLNGKSLQELLSGETVIWSEHLTLRAAGAYIYISK